MTRLLFFLLLTGLSEAHAQDAVALVDVAIYGDSAAAITAAVSVRRMGHTVIVINPTRFPGGMSSSGLGASDFGKRSILGGVTAEFYARIASHYRKTFVRSFEPHVGREAFEAMIADAGIDIVYCEQLDRDHGVAVEHGRIVSITTRSGKTYRARMFIDATYVGDLMAAAGVTYTIGREAESAYGESIAGVRRGDSRPRSHYGQSNKDHFVVDVDPYVRSGDPTSGLLPLVHDVRPRNGTGDRKIQAYNYRLCLTKRPDLRVPIERPKGYRALDHELLLRNFEAGDHRLPGLIEQLEGEGSKIDWNHKQAIGSDFAGANWEYPEADYATRRRIEKAHELYIRGFLWTLANSPRVPPKVRAEALQWGLCKDEFGDNDHWPPMIYIREARRMVSDYVMTQLDCSHHRQPRDPVALGAFGMDSHVVQYFVDEHGHVRRDGTIWRVPPHPYGISYRAIVPKKGECANLLVPVTLSASHVAHGSIRMEPVFMTLGQAAATAAVLAIEANAAVQDVDYVVLRARLIADGVPLGRTGTAVDQIAGIVVDDGAAVRTGAWQTSRYADFIGHGYLHDGNSDKGEKSLRFAAKALPAGAYEVRLSYSPHRNRANNVPVTVLSAEGERTVIVNQRKKPPIDGRFISLGVYRSVPGKSMAVIVGTKGTAGYVVADAVQWVRR